MTTIEPTTTISNKFIGSAVERTNRPINKSAILGSLEALLTREVEAGNFMKVAEDTYSLPPLPPSTYQPPTSYPMPIAGSNISLSPQNISSDPAHPGQNSMMSVPITPLIPSTPPPINSQLDQNNQAMMTPMHPGNSIQGQSPSKLQPTPFIPKVNSSQPLSLTSEPPMTHLVPNPGAVVATSSPQFPLTSMVRQTGRLTPDSRASIQHQQVQISLTSPEMPLTPPPLTIQPQNSVQISSASTRGTILPTTTIMSTVPSVGITLHESGGMSVIQNTRSSDMDSPSPMSNMHKQGQTVSIQQQLQPNLVSPQHYPVHSMTPTCTPPPASPSLQAQQLSLNLMDRTALNIASQNIQPGQLSIQSNSSSTDEKSDEEKKNALINEKLFKINSFQGSKSQTPTRQKSIDKGEGQKNKSKKSKEKQQATMTLFRDSGDESAVIGNMSAVIKQEVPYDGSANLHIHNTFGDDSSNNGQTNELSKSQLSSLTENKATLLINNGIKVENVSVATGDRLEMGKNLSYESCDMRYGINDNPNDEKVKMTNEFVVPGNMAITSRNENIGMRKKVSEILLFISSKF